MNGKDVFISYKSEEIIEAKWVRSFLEHNGISCWMAPLCIPGGSSYAVEIPRAIKEAKVFVLILSSKAQASQWISREIDLAINEGKLILPFMIENFVLKDEFKFYLANVQRYAAYENKLAAAGRMLNEIKSFIYADVTEREIKDISPEVDKANGISPPITVNKPKYEPKSILCLVFGAASAVTGWALIFIPHIVAIILSVSSLKSIKRGNKSGKGFAVMGQALSLISAVFQLTVLFKIVGFVIAVSVAVVSLIIFIKQYKLLKIE